jgi:hypothetical protein
MNWDKKYVAVDSPERPKAVESDDDEVSMGEQSFEGTSSVVSEMPSEDESIACTTSTSPRTKTAATDRSKAPSLISLPAEPVNSPVPVEVPMQLSEPQDVDWDQDNTSLLDVKRSFDDLDEDSSSTTSLPASSPRLDSVGSICHRDISHAPLRKRIKMVADAEQGVRLGDG